MKVLDTAIAEVKILEPIVHGDERGFFLESWNQRVFDQAIGRAVRFVQDNHSRSAQGVLRGLHYQLQQPQGKLLRVLRGRVFDVAVDLRRSSPSFGRHVAAELSEHNQRQLWVPEGFAHGFLVLSESADIAYKTTDFYHPASERALRWDDARLGIAWPDTGNAPLLSAKDRDAAGFDPHGEYFA